MPPMLGTSSTSAARSGAEENSEAEQGESAEIQSVCLEEMGCPPGG